MCQLLMFIVKIKGFYQFLKPFSFKRLDSDHIFISSLKEFIFEISHAQGRRMSFDQETLIKGKIDFFYDQIISLYVEELHKKLKREP